MKFPGADCRYDARMDPRDIPHPQPANTLARDLLEDAFPLVLVEGELAASRARRPGTVFSLKDERAQVRCAMFKPKSSWLKFQPRDGRGVLARGRLTLYEARGDYQLVCDSLEEAWRRRAAPRVRGTQGQARRRRPVRPWRASGPCPPSRAASACSPRPGAVVRDVLSVLRERPPLAEIEVLPVPVQGATAAAQIRGMLARDPVRAL